MAVFLNGVQQIAQDFIDLADIAEPDPPASGVRVYSRDEQGFSVLSVLDGNIFPLRVVQDAVRIARNTTGSQINRGQVVFFTGATGDVPNVALAKADSETTMPAVGVARQDVANNAFGEFLIVGRLEDFDTSAFSAGDRVFVSATEAGGMTNTRPGHPNFEQPLGVVEVSGVGNGAIIFNIGVNSLGEESGTRFNAFAIGDGAAGAKKLEIVNDSGRSALEWEPTAVRTITLPDKDATLDDASDTRDPNAHDNTTHTFRGALVKLDANQAIPTGGGVSIVDWESAEYDTDSFWEGVTNPSRLTVPSGVTRVRVGANVTWEANTTGIRSSFMLKNGAEFQGEGAMKLNTAASGVTWVNLTSAVVDVSEGDYFELRVQQESGDSLDLLTHNATWFFIEVIE